LAVVVQPAVVSVLVDFLRGNLYVRPRAQAARLADSVAGTLSGDGPCRRISWRAWGNLPSSFASLTLVRCLRSRPSRGGAQGPALSFVTPEESRGPVRNPRPGPWGNVLRQINRPVPPVNCLRSNFLRPLGPTHPAPAHSRLPDFNRWISFRVLLSVATVIRDGSRLEIDVIP
jgi:hypothetical protein